MDGTLVGTRAHTDPGRARAGAMTTIRPRDSGGIYGRPLPARMGGCASHAFEERQHENRCSTFRYAFNDQICQYIDSVRASNPSGPIPLARLRTTHRAFGAHAAFLPAPTIGTVTGVGTVLVTSVGQL